MHPGPNSLKVLKGIVSENGIDDYYFASELLISYFAFEGSGGVYRSKRRSYSKTEESINKIKDDTIIEALKEDAV